MKKHYLLQSIIKPFIVLFILLSSHLVVAEEDLTKSPYDNITNPTPENLPTYSGTCEDLTPAKNLDDLILQLYSHLDDDCLYLMPSAELAQKLNINIVSPRENYPKPIPTPKELQYYYQQFKKQPYHDLKNGILLYKQGIFTGKIAKLSLLEQREYSPSNPNWQRNPNYYADNNGFVIYFSDDYKKQTNFTFTPDEFPSQLPAPQVNTNPQFYDAMCHGEEYYWYGYTYSFIYLRRCHNERARALPSELRLKKMIFRKQ